MSEWICRHDLVIPMRDGVRLYADLTRPNDNDKHPALVVRIP